MKTKRVNWKNSRGFTIVEVVVVAALIAVVATIAATAVIQARNKAADAICISNLQQIARAKALWGIEHKATGTETPPEDELFGPETYLKAKPVCPMNGTYTVNPLNENPSCNKPRHVIPE